MEEEEEEEKKKRKKNEEEEEEEATQRILCICLKAHLLGMRSQYHLRK